MVFIIIITSSVTIYSLLLSNIYRAEAIILPTKPSSGGRIPCLSNLAGLLGLAEMADVSIPISFNVAEIKDRLNSKIFYEELIKKYKLMPILFSEQ